MIPAIKAIGAKQKNWDSLTSCGARTIPRPLVILVIIKGAVGQMKSLQVHVGSKQAPT